MSFSYFFCTFLLFSTSVSLSILPIGNQDLYGVKVADPTFLVNFCASTRDHIFSKSIHCLFCKGFHYSCWHTTTPATTIPTTISTTPKILPTVAPTTPSTLAPTTSKTTTDVEGQE